MSTADSMLRGRALQAAHADMFADHKTASGDSSKDGSRRGKSKERKKQKKVKGSRKERNSG